MHARAGRLAEAERELDGLGPARAGWYTADAELTRATIAAARGQAAEAVDWAERVIAASATEAWRTRWRNTARVVPVLAAAGATARGARRPRDGARRAPAAGELRAAVALQGWLHALDGDDAAAVDAVRRAWEEAGAATPHLVRREWPRLDRVVWQAVERGALPPERGRRRARGRLPRCGCPAAVHPPPRRRDAPRGGRRRRRLGHPDAGARLAELERDPDADVAGAARSARARLAATPPALAFSLLGGFALRRGAHPVADDAWGPRRRAAQRLVRFLLVHRDHAVPEDVLFAAFWRDAGVDAARRSLQVTLSSARAVLDPGGERGRIVVADRTYRLRPAAHDTIDADAFAQAARGALERTPASPPGARPRSRRPPRGGAASRSRRTATRTGRRSGASAWSTSSGACWPRWPRRARRRGTPARPSRRRAGRSSSTSSTRPRTAG